jgi:hypothetical protein
LAGMSSRRDQGEALSQMVAVVLAAGG